GVVPKKPRHGSIRGTRNSCVYAAAAPGKNALVTGVPGCRQTRPGSRYTCVSPTASSPAAPPDTSTTASIALLGSACGAGGPDRALLTVPATSCTSALSTRTVCDVIVAAPDT